MRQKVGLISLGCAKNLVDSEVMLGLLDEAGYTLTPHEGDADILIINTCAFIDSAKEEAVQTILEMGRHKTEGKCELLIVTGCLAQRYEAELKSQMPEVDAFVGTGQFPQIVKICEQLTGASPKETRSWVESPDYLYDSTTPRIRTTPGYSAYVKISEGCSHRCTYCIIPQLRGPLRSRPVQSIIAEAQNLAARGVKEINLIAQDTTGYGRDLSAEHNLQELLRQLVKIGGLEWIRLLYGHPASIPDELLELIAGEEKICSYIDLPLQHIHNDILKSMGRKITRFEIESLITRMRGVIPGLTLRTSLIVGFPGEKDQHFQALFDFVEQARFDCLGVFTYSKEEGTPAGEFSGQVPKKVKEQRRDHLLKLQRAISRQRHQSMIGSRHKVLIENDGLIDGYIGQGRTMGQAPEVDGVVYIQQGRVAPGEIIPVKIVDALEYDIVGEVIPNALAQ